MTILNNTSDGLHPELIVLFRAVAYLGKVETGELIRICLSGAASDTSVLNRLRGALSRWTELGLFVENEGHIQLDSKFVKKRQESIDEFTCQLPSICRRLVLEKKNIFPLWGESSAVASDFARGITWLLTQDIYGFPTTWTGGAEDIEREQIIGGEKVVQNDTRWTNLRFWARYLGFASGDSGSFQIDPTSAIRDELPLVFGYQRELPANDFLSALSAQLPVLDFGVYRQEVENKLSATTWRKPAEGHLSMSLSLALRRLDLNSTIKLAGKADAGGSFRLTGRNYRTWIGFESVIWDRGGA